MSAPFMRQGYYPTDDDYYVILDVDFYASQDEISTAYKKLARKFHPDKNNHDERSRKEAEVIFGKIKTAYDVLGDPRRRQIYDTLGPEGVKMDGWKLVRKQMTAQEIRDEYLRIQKRRLDNKLAVVAKPRASFTMSIDASDLFSRSQLDPMEDEEDWDEVPDDSIIQLPSIEINSMSASMAVENNIATNHSMTLFGNVNTKNGTGDCSFGTNYKYKYSPSTKYDIFYQFGNGPLLTTGVSYQMNEKTNLALRGFLLMNQYGIAPGAKLTLSHQIRSNLIGRISYKEGLNPVVSTSLVYVNEKLSIEVTTAYKLSKIDQGLSLEFGHRFNNNESKLSITLAASSSQGVAVEYGCETRVLDINVLGASLSFSLPSGVTLKLRFNRANQEFNIPIYLSDEVHSAPVFYGTMVPLLTYYLIDRYYLRQYKQLR